MNQRLKRVNELLQKELSFLVIKDLAPTDYLITISYVDCSNDLSLARIGVTVLPKNKKNQALRDLKKNLGEWRLNLKKKLKLKKIPKFQLLFDQSLQKAAEIEQILKKIKENERN